ncbi:MAG: hypothetical protein LBP51_05925 [Deferribacteraceae bacterium]|jgi:hypothetical protein|nr:hypothetical protein [Deferribacteraceae bacterium]
MKIFAGALGGTNNTLVKTVTVNKVRNKLRFLNARTMSMHAFASKVDEGTHVTCEYVDAVSAESEFPPLNDKKAFAMLAKSKVQDQLLPDVRYAFAFSEATLPRASDSAPSVSVMKSYNIYAVPADLITQYSGGSTMAGNIAYLTLDQFSMMAFSEKVATDKLICHAYADKSQLLITFSYGNNLIYSRISSVPKSFDSKEDRLNFYYETLNLTYVYMRQSRQLPVDMLIFSGLLKYEKELEESVKNFSGHEVQYLEPSQYISDCREDIFDEYMLAIGCCLADPAFNFVPVTNNELISYKQVLLVVNLCFAVLVLAAFVACVLKAAKYVELRGDISSRTQRLTSTLNQLNAVIGDENELRYYNTYINALRQRETSPINAIVKAQELLYMNTYEEIRFVLDNKNESSVIVRKKETFDTYTSTYDFQRKYNSYIDNFKALSPIANSKLRIPDRTYDMDMQLLNNRGTDE